MKVGDLIKHKSQPAELGIVTKVDHYGPPVCAVYVEALWCSDWLNGRIIEQHYLEVISASR